MDRIQQMTTFVAVAEAGSFVGAADANGFSKAAVSRHVAELEQRLGVRLFHRTTRRLSLTDEGQHFYGRSKELLASLDSMEAEIASNTDEPSGLLRVNAPLTFGILHLAPLWGRFIERYPKVSLDVNLDDQILDLVKEGYDIAIRITNMPNSQLVSRRLATTRMVLCASPEYLRQHGEPQHPRDLAQHRIISYTYWTEKAEWSFTGPNGEASVHIEPLIHTNNGDTCRVAALDHHGIILQPDFLIGGDLQRGDLVEVMRAYRSIELGIYAVYPSRKHLPVRMRRLLDFLAESFRQPVWMGSSGG